MDNKKKFCGATTHTRFAPLPKIFLFLICFLIFNCGTVLGVEEFNKTAQDEYISIDLADKILDFFGNYAYFNNLQNVDRSGFASTVNSSGLFDGNTQLNDLVVVCPNSNNDTTNSSTNYLDLYFLRVQNTSNSNNYNSLALDTYYLRGVLNTTRFQERTENTTINKYTSGYYFRLYKNGTIYSTTEVSNKTTAEFDLTNGSFYKSENSELVYFKNIYSFGFTPIYIKATQESMGYGSYTWVTNGNYYTGYTGIEEEPTESGDTSGETGGGTGSGGSNVDLGNIEQGIGDINNNLGEIKDKIPTSGDINNAIGEITKPYNPEDDILNDMTEEDILDNMGYEAIDDPYQDLWDTIINGMKEVLTKNENVIFEIEFKDFSYILNSKDIYMPENPLKTFIGYFVNVMILMKMFTFIKKTITKISEGAMDVLENVGCDIYFF